MRLSVAGKGLFLVAVPLVFELVFVGGLVFSLKETEGQIEKQLRSQALVEQTTILMRELVSASYGICFRYLSEEPPMPPSESKQGVLDTIQNLEKTAGKDERLQQSSREIRRAIDTFYASLEHFAEMSPSDLVFGVSGKATLMEVRKDMQLIDRAVRKFRLLSTKVHEIDLEDSHSSNWKKMLLAGLLLNLVLTVVLALSFARSISFRLRKLAENTSRVSRSLPPLPPLGGGDEVSDLDLVIHKMAAQLSLAEAQRSQLSAMLRNKLAEPLDDARGVLIGLGESVSLPERAKKSVNKASQQLERLVRLLDDLTALEQIESGQIELKRKELSSADLVSKANEAVQSLASKKNIHLLSAGENQLFSGDGERLTQVLINLLSNAIKFSPENGNILVSVAGSSGELEFRVKDEGPGIPKELQAKIFEKYEQSRREDATTRGGAGLGLNICSAIASSHGGNLGVDSEPGQGSEFWLRLPLSEKSQVGPPAPKLLPAPKKDAKPGFKIWQKGLVLVAVPLLFQISFVAFLGSLLVKAQREAVLEMHAKSIKTVGNEMYRVVVNLAATAGGGYVSGAVTDIEKVAHSREIDNLLAQFPVLFALEKNDPMALQLVCRLTRDAEKVFLTTSKLMLAPPPGKTIGVLAVLKKRVAAIQRSQDVFAERIDLIVRKQSDIEAKSPALRTEIHAQIVRLIVIAVILSVLLSVILGLFFSKSISKRLGTLIENTLRFTDGKDELLPELKGNDELSDFDQDFRLMLTRIRENQEFKKHMLAVVSHELRTPLTSISGSVLLLHDGAYGELSGENQEGVKKVQQDIMLVMQLVNDLLDIERMEAAKFPMDIKDVELMQTVEAGLALCKKQVPQVDFRVNSSLAGKAIVTVDPDLMAKAISKLLLFCAAEEQEGGSLTIQLEQKNSDFLLKVQDNAKWLTAGDAQLYEKFQLLEREDSQNKKGVALSLALCKTILAHMGHELSSVPPTDGAPGEFIIRILNSR